MFFSIIAIVHILLCLSLMGLVLLQQGKGADAGAVMGGGADSIMGAGAAGTVVSKATTALAIGFMITSIVLVKFYDQAVVAREAGTNVLDGSVMQGVSVELPAADEAEAPAADAGTAVEAEAGSGVTIVAEETEAAAPVAKENTAETEKTEAAEAPAAAESSEENAAAEAGSEEKDVVEK